MAPALAFDSPIAERCDRTVPEPLALVVAHGAKGVLAIRLALMVVDGADDLADQLSGGVILARGGSRGGAGARPLRAWPKQGLPARQAGAAEKLHDEITADYTDMICADQVSEIEQRRRAFLCTWRLHEKFKRRIKTQTVLPAAETAAMLCRALLASGQIGLREVDGWQNLAERPTAQTTIDRAA